MVNIKSWFAELMMLSSIKIPRCLQSNREVTSITLRTCICGCISISLWDIVYLRSECENGDIVVRFVASKMKVAPLQSISVPHLELMGAVLGKRLALSVAKTLMINKPSITFWTDSISVLWWVKGYSRQFKPFVANRIGEIQSEISSDRWRYIPTSENPADYLTCGTTLVELSQLRVWWEGRAFLSKGEIDWPQLKITATLDNNVDLC